MEFQLTISNPERWCQQIWKTQQWPQDWKRTAFIPIPKKGNAKECSKYCTTDLISHASKVRIKIIPARLQQYTNRELPDAQAGFQKRQRNQRLNCQHPFDYRKGQGNSRKTSISASLTPLKPFTVDHNKLWKVLQEMGILDHRNLFPKKLVCGTRSNS